jgi:hypothetical protein
MSIGVANAFLGDNPEKKKNQSGGEAPPQSRPNCLTEIDPRRTIPRGLGSACEAIEKLRLRDTPS